MIAELSSIEKKALIQLWNGTYTEAGTPNKLMDDLQRKYKLVAWSDKRYMLTDTGRAVGEKLARDGNHFEAQADKIAELENKVRAIKQAYQHGLAQIRQHAIESDKRADDHANLIANALEAGHKDEIPEERRFMAMETNFRDGLLRAIQHMERLAKLLDE